MPLYKMEKYISESVVYRDVLLLQLNSKSGKLTVQLFYLKTGKNKCILSIEMHAHVPCFKQVE